MQSDKDKNSSSHFIKGGITAPLGFTANGIIAGIKPNRNKNDMALVFSDTLCNCAGVFTKNQVKAESVKLTKCHIANGKAQAIVVNVGFANACTGEEGKQNALLMAKKVSEVLNINQDDVVVGSTGVIGAQLPIKKIEDAIPKLAKGLCKENHTEASIGIMTTDTHNKECAYECEIGGKPVRFGSMCKGSGMIHINMGTMLGFVTTDCAISSKMLQRALNESILGTYNCVSVDGDTSTNDTLVILANGKAGNIEIKTEGKDYQKFLCALNTINTVMAKKIASDGEGATRLVECNVVGASTTENARKLAKEVISSSLVKAAMFGRDANFGRFLCAMGYSGVPFTIEKTSIWFTSNKGALRYFDETKPFEVHGKNAVQVFKDGNPVVFDEEKAKEIMSEQAVEILIECKDGNARGTAWGCDLTYDYVKINGDYRS